MRYTLTAIAILITTMAFGQRQYIANLEIAPDSNAAWTIYTDTNGVQQYFKFDSILYDIFQIDTLGGTDTRLTAEQVQDSIAPLLLGTQSLITVDYDDPNNQWDFAVEPNLSNYTNDPGFITATLTQEEVEDYAGAMFSGNTETLITATYQDADGTIDLVVDDDLSNYDNSTSGFVTSNNYLTGLSFNTSTGVLTGTRQGLTDVTEDLDGRYLNLAAFNVGDVTGGKRISVSPTSGTYDNFELLEGTNITMSRSANEITINAAGGSSNWTDNGSTLEPASGENVYTGASAASSSWFGLNGNTDFFIESTASSVFTITPTQGSTGAAGFYYAPGSNFMRIGDQSGTRDNISFGGISSSTDDAGTGGADNYLYINSSGYLSSAPSGTHNVTTSSTLSDQDVVCYNTTSSATIVPQTFTSEGKMYIIINNTVGNITIDPGSSTQINGASTYTLAGNRALTIIYASGAYWTTAETPIN